MAVLTKTFGLEYIEIAEDIASETFLQALDSWPYKGVPENPAAWLYTVAKNKTKNHLARDNNFKTNISRKLKADRPFDEMEIDFSEPHIADSQLQMLFAICHPSISTEAQICMALRTLCGLGVDEIADAFLTNRETIHKRLQRAKSKLLEHKVHMEIPADTVIHERLDTVLQTIYLLFSEGYYSESNNAIIRTDLCVEALNLTYLLLGNPSTNNHSANALMSLMCFQSSRLEARKGVDGHLILYDDQDRSLWDTEFIEKGFHYLQQASQWEITSKYYLEASIAYWHTVDNGHAEKWISILKLYDVLLLTNSSPVVALNRIWAFSKVHGHHAAITELERLDLRTNHFYFILQAELYKSIDASRSVTCLKNALGLCKTDKEREMLAAQIRKIEGGQGF